MERTDWAAAGVTEEQKGYLQALSDVRSWHRWELAQCLGDVRRMEAQEKAIAWLDLLIATKQQHAAEDEFDQRPRAASITASSKS